MEPYNIIIREDGTLELYRHKWHKRQMCPFTEQTFCGDWCPHFQENWSVNKQRGTVIRLECSGVGLLGPANDKR